MQIINPSYEILTPINGVEILKFLEKIGRVCYKSEEKITDNSYIPFITNIVNRGHHAMLEHFSISVKFICDRGVSHELVRHRLASFAQESTRYCNYGSDKKGITFIQPCWFKESILGVYDSEMTITKYGDEYGGVAEMPASSEDFIPAIKDSKIKLWFDQMLNISRQYDELSCHDYFTNSESWNPQESRSILPNSLKTEIVITANLREWMHILDLRAAPTAHPQMRELMVPLLIDFYTNIPILFNKTYGKCCTTQA